RAQRPVTARRFSLSRRGRGCYRSGSMRQRALAVALLLVASGVRAQVSCSNPDNLCTGDPCVIENGSVASSCVVDFGARALVVRGTVHVPDGGVLSFSAGAITVEKPGRIDAVHGDVGGNAGDITLQANGGIDVSGRLDASGAYGHIGTIIVEAGGALSTA